MSRPKITSMGIALPPNSYTQDEVFEELGYPKVFRRLFSGSEIDKRHFWVQLERIKELSFQEQQEEYLKGAIALSKKAILNCIDGRDPLDIGCLVFCSCTGFAPGPTVGHYLVKEIGLDVNIYISNLASHGCEGGFPGLKRAYDYSSTSGKPSLIVACELSSCSSFPENGSRPDPENHFELARANAIFADAASCCLVGYDNDWRHPQVMDTESYFNVDYMNDLGYVWRDGRLRVLLSRRVPELATEVVGFAVGKLLRRQKLPITDIHWWVIHAAGSKVLDNIRDALRLPEEKLLLSREILRAYGNCSSSTIGLIGKRLMDENIQPEDQVMVLSVGPGMVGGSTLLRFGGE